MAKIIENRKGRRLIKLNTDDIVNIVREYQNITYKSNSYEEIRTLLNKSEFFLPEEPN